MADIVAYICIAIAYLLLNVLTMLILEVKGKWRWAFILFGVPIALAMLVGAVIMAIRRR